MPAHEPTSTVCHLCGRHVPNQLITLHHLLPKQKGGTAAERVPLCRPCHKQLHAVFSNGELAKRFATIDALRVAEELQAFLKWIRKQPGHRTFQTRMSGAHPEARRRR
jgi:5-methylcytosine-specific restriction enzyme A